MARDKYLKELDKNSKYFHVLARFKKRKKNQILMLKVGRPVFHHPRAVNRETREIFR